MADFDAKAMIKRIESVLTEKGMSKEEFYAKSKVSSASFSQWNTGTHKPTPKKIFAVAQCLGVSVEFLTGEEQKEKPTLQTESELDPVTQEIFDMMKDMSKEELLLLKARAEKIKESR